MSKYNAPIPEDISLEALTLQRGELLSQIFGAVGKAAYVGLPLMIDYGCNIKVGDNFYANFK
jgi:hypothetical protein